MLDFFIFNGLIVLFGLLSVFESKLNQKLDLKSIRQARVSFPLAAVLLVSGLMLTLIFLLLGPRVFVLYYMKASFSLLLIGHAIWLGLNKNRLRKFFYAAIAFIIIFLRFIFPNLLTHNLFLYSGLLWFGPLFVRIKWLTPKRFMILSLIWFIYDIVYVWFTPIAENIVSTTQSLGFPLAITIGDHFIGTADLLWLNCLVAVVKKPQVKWLSVFLLTVSQLLLMIYALFNPNLILFPLLVLWVPLGILLIKIDNSKFKTQNIP